MTASLETPVLESPDLTDPIPSEWLHTCVVQYVPGPEKVAFLWPSRKGAGNNSGQGMVVLSDVECIEAAAWRLSRNALKHWRFCCCLPCMTSVLHRK